MATAGIIESPPYFQTNIFNTRAFESDTNLTKPEADRLYLSISAGVNLGLIDAITPGQASASKALILDANKDIIGIRNMGLTGDLTLSGGSSHLYLTGSASGIDLTGNNANVSILGAGGHLIVSNTEAANDTGSQAAIKCSGGIYSNANCYFGSTAQISGILSCLNTTDASSLTSGALTIAGGCSISKTLYVKTIVCDNSAGGDLITLSTSSSTARSAIRLVTNETSWLLSARASGVSDGNTLNIQNGSDYRLQMKTNGDTKILSSTASTSKTTGCLVLSGGLGIAGDTWMSQLKLNSFGSHLSFNNDNSAGTALIELAAAPSILRLVRGYAINIGASGIRIGSGSTAEATRPLDFGSTSSDCLISLYGDGSYAFGAADNAIKYSSASHHYFYTGGLANTILAKMESSGNFSAAGGIHSTGFANPNNSGSHMHFGGGTASFFGYDYPNSRWLPSQIGSCVYVVPADSSNGNSSFGGLSINSTSYICPLYVNGSKNFTRNPTTSYGYVASSGAGQASSAFTNRPFSAYFESGLLVAASEINCYSDTRTKKDITNITTERAMKFISMDPINFRYKNSDESLKAGYKAQQLLAANFNDLVALSQLNGDDVLEPEDVHCDDGLIVHLQSDEKLVLNMQAAIPYLHKALQEAFRIIEQQQKQINELYSKLL